MKVTLAIEGMHCTSCAMTIDEELEDLPGVKRAKTSYARERATSNTTLMRLQWKLLSAP